MIRSYHEVGRSFTETMIYTLGKKQDGQTVRLSKPLPLMMLVWFLLTLGVVALIAYVLGISPIPKHPRNPAASGPPTLFFIGLPIAVSYVMTLAEVEGRRVHVLLRVWIRRGRSRHYIGGWLPAQRLRSVRYRNIKVLTRPRYRDAR